MSITSRFCLILAFCLPSLLAFNQSPSPTLLNQLLAVGGWGALLISLPGPLRPGACRALTWPLAALGLLAACVVLSWRASLPDSMALAALATLSCAAMVLLASQAQEAPLAGGSVPMWRAALQAVVVTGVLGALIGVLQVFAPEWTDGRWIARSGLAGRAVGNLRQPNHLSTLLLWGLIALVPLAQPTHRRGLGWLAVAAAVLMTLGVVLTASRTGAVGMLLLAVWGLADRRLDRKVRLALLAAPLAYLAIWLVMAGWAHETHKVFGGQARLAAEDISASRFAIWSDTWGLLKAQPWLGVGFGEFNFAWSLTPFPHRPVAFFDHCHNLLLQFAVELGLPLAVLLTGMILVSLALAFQRCWRAEGESGVGARAALMMVLLVGLHSQLEYPLWYTYFLLPTAWALGYALRRPPACVNDNASADMTRPSLERLRRLALPAMGALMLLGAGAAMLDYRSVVLIYQPDENGTALPERIAKGQRSWLFAHHADYADATTTEPPERAMAAFASTTHSLLDTRLMMAWAHALEGSGHRDQARYLAARLREFHNAASTEFFAVCDAPAADKPLPFQCEAPQRAWNWREFQH